MSISKENHPGIILEKSLTQLILNFKWPKEGEEGYAIAIDAPWGAGKTTFIRQFLKNIRENDDFLIVSGESKPVIPILFNAWEHDNFEDPFIPLVACILDEVSEDLGQATFEDRFVNSLNTIGKVFIKRALGSDPIENYEKGMADIKDLKPSSGAINNWVQPYHNYRQDVDFFKQSLSDLGEKDGITPTKIIVVDELDRCNPLFASRLLERVKHLFLVDNVIFIFSTNITELKEVINHQYGAGFNSVTYLNRFFNPILNYAPSFQALYNKTEPYADPSVVAEFCKYFDFQARDIIALTNYLDNLRAMVGRKTNELDIFMFGLKIYNIESYKKAKKINIMSKEIDSYTSSDFYVENTSEEEQYIKVRAEEELAIKLLKYVAKRLELPVLKAPFFSFGQKSINGKVGKQESCNFADFIRSNTIPKTLLGLLLYYIKATGGGGK